MVLGRELERGPDRRRPVEGFLAGLVDSRQDGPRGRPVRAVLDLPAEVVELLAERIGASPVACVASLGSRVEQASHVGWESARRHRRKYSPDDLNVPGGPTAPQPYYPTTSRSYRTCPCGRHV